MYQLIYLLLEQRLKTVSGIKHVDLYTDQDLFTTDINPAFNTPAVLVDFMGDWQTADLGQKLQKVEGSFKLHIINFIADTHVAYMKKLSAQHFIQDRDVFVAIQKYSAKLSQLPGFEELNGTDQDHQILNSIARTNYGMAQDYGPILKTTQTYKFISIDFSATPLYIALQPQIELLTSFS